jgi:hypothetical protein
LPQAARVEPEAATTPVTTVDQQKIEALTRPEPQPVQPQAGSEPKKKTAELEQANEKLSALLGKPKE